MVRSSSIPLITLQESLQAGCKNDAGMEPCEGLDTTQHYESTKVGNVEA